MIHTFNAPTKANSVVIYALEEVRLLCLVIHCIEQDCYTNESSQLITGSESADDFDKWVSQYQAQSAWSLAVDTYKCPLLAFPTGRHIWHWTHLVPSCFAWLGQRLHEWMLPLQQGQIFCRNLCLAPIKTLEPLGMLWRLIHLSHSLWILVPNGNQLLADSQVKEQVHRHPFPT